MAVQHHGLTQALAPATIFLMRHKAIWFSFLVVATLAVFAFDPSWRMTGSDDGTVVGISRPSRLQPSSTEIQARLTDGRIVSASAMTIPGRSYIDGDHVKVTTFETLLLRSTRYTAEPASTSGGL